MSPEYYFHVKANLKSADEAIRLRDTFKQFKGIEEVKIFSPLQPLDSIESQELIVNEPLDPRMLGHLLREVRLGLGIPQAVLARRANIGRNTVWVTERGENPKTGKPSRISKERLERWMDTLQIGPEEQADILVRAGYIRPQSAQTILT